MSNCKLDTQQTLLDLINKNVTLTSCLSIEEIVNYIYSSNETLQFVAIQNYKTLLHKSRNDIEDNIVSRSIELLDNYRKYVYENLKNLSI